MMVIDTHIISKPQPSWDVEGLIKIITIYKSNEEERINYSKQKWSCFIVLSVIQMRAREEFVGEVFNLNGKHVLVEGIPEKVCARCGDKTFSRGTTEKI